MNRIEWVDIAKFLGIIAVIIGHTVTGLAKCIIFSFHMPLFFSLSMVTFKLSNSKEEFINKILKNLLTLVLPALITWTIITIVVAAQNPNSAKNIIWWGKMTYEFIFFPCNDSKLPIVHLPAIWFLLTLFIAKTLIDGANLLINEKKLLIIISLFCCLIGYLFGKNYYLPFGLDIALTCMPVFLFGYYLKKLDLKNHTF